MALVCLFLLNDIAWADLSFVIARRPKADEAISTLAPQSRLVPFFDKYKDVISLKDGFSIAYAAAELRKIFLKRPIRDGDIARVNKSKFADGEVDIVKDVGTKEYTRLIFILKKTGRRFEVLLRKDGANLTQVLPVAPAEDEMKRLAKLNIRVSGREGGNLDEKYIIRCPGMTIGWPVPLYRCAGPGQIAYIGRDNWSTTVILPANSGINAYTEEATVCPIIIMRLLDAYGAERILLSHILDRSSPAPTVDQQVASVILELKKRRMVAREIIFSPAEDTSYKHALMDLQRFLGKDTEIKFVLRKKVTLASSMVTASGWSIYDESVHKYVSGAWINTKTPVSTLNARGGAELKITQARLDLTYVHQAWEAMTASRGKSLSSVDCVKRYWGDINKYLEAVVASPDIIVFPEGIADLEGHIDNTDAEANGIEAACEEGLRQVAAFVKESGIAVGVGSLAKGDNAYMNGVYYMIIPQNGSVKVNRFVKGRGSEEDRVVDIKGQRLGLVICNEIYNEPTLSRLKPALIQTLLIPMAASPEREAEFIQIAKDNGFRPLTVNYLPQTAAAALPKPKPAAANIMAGDAAKDVQGGTERTVPENAARDERGGDDRAGVANSNRMIFESAALTAERVQGLNKFDELISERAMVSFETALESRVKRLKNMDTEKSDATIRLIHELVANAWRGVGAHDEKQVRAGLYYHSEGDILELHILQDVIEQDNIKRLWNNHLKYQEYGLSYFSETNEDRHKDRSVIANYGFGLLLFARMALTNGAVLEYVINGDTMETKLYIRLGHVGADTDSSASTKPAPAAPPEPKQFLPVMVVDTGKPGVSAMTKRPAQQGIHYELDEGVPTITYEQAAMFVRDHTLRKPMYSYAREDNARNLILASLDTIPGFKDARDRNDIKTMARLYREHVIAYTPKNTERYKSKGQQAFFCEVGGLSGLLSCTQPYFRKEYSPAEFLRLALPDLINLTNPNALNPLDVECYYWTDPENAKYHVLQALDTIPGFKDARDKNDIKTMARLYRAHVIAYKPEGEKRRRSRGQDAFFCNVGGLASLFTHPRPYFKKTTTAECLRLVLPGLIDPNNRDALRPSEVEVINNGKPLSDLTEKTIKALEASGGNVEKAASILDAHPASIYRTMKVIRKDAIKRADTATLDRLNRVTKRTWSKAIEDILKEDTPQAQSTSAKPAPTEMQTLAKNEPVPIYATEAEVKSIHDKNMKREYMPAIPQKTMLCHIIADTTVPEGQKGMLQRLEQKMRETDNMYEKVVRLKINNPDDPKEFMAKLEEVRKREESFYTDKGFVVELDVACHREDIVAKIQNKYNLKIQALAFSRAEGCDAIQVEGIMLALRALRTCDIGKLLAAYKFLTGQDKVTDKTDINELAKDMLFVMPAAKVDINHVDALNRLIEESIWQAA